MAGTTTTARRAPRKTTPRAKRPVAVPREQLDGHQPIRIVTTGPAPEVELVEAFSIDDRSYFIPKHVSPSVSLKFMKMARKGGMEIALGELLEQMLGEEAYDALANCPHVTDEQFWDVMQLVRHHAMGVIERPKGTSKSA